MWWRAPRATKLFSRFSPRAETAVLSKPESLRSILKIPVLRGVAWQNRATPLKTGEIPPMPMLPFPGELAALISALIWAITSSSYGALGRRMPPMVLNLTKNSVAIAFLTLTLLLQVTPPPLPPLHTTFLLGLSGIIGIGIGDSVFFTAINQLGARRALLLESLAPVFAALSARLWLDEALTTKAWLGILLTVAGVTWVILERVPDRDGKPSVHLPLHSIAIGILAALCQAGGAVLSRAALVEQTSVTPLASALIRLAAGGLSLGLWLLWQSATRRSLQPLRSPRFLLILCLTAFFGTYIGIWLQQVALQLTAAGIAQALGATSPLFALPVAMWGGDRVTLRTGIGVGVAIVGIYLLFNRG
jgi:drug/metabolite transporter (DMT)-like permease